MSVADKAEQGLRDPSRLSKVVPEAQLLRAYAKVLSLTVNYDR